MRRAARAALTTLQRSWPDARQVAILAGPGHNGGDGAVLAGLAQGRGLACTLFYLSPPKTADAQRARDYAEAAGVAFAPSISLILRPSTWWSMASWVRAARPVRGPWPTALSG